MPAFGSPLAPLNVPAVYRLAPQQSVELSQLRKQLFEQQRLAREAEGQLSAAARDKEELAARVALLQETVEQLERCETA